MARIAFRQFKYGRRGFTLIELLVVIAILGVLAAVAFPNVAKFIGSNKTEAASTELANVQAAVTAYMADKMFKYFTVLGESVADGDALATLDDLAPYLNHAVNGSYTFTEVGGVTQNSYP